MFQKCLYMGIANYSHRYKIWTEQIRQILTRERCIAGPEVDITALARIADGYSSCSIVRCISQQGKVDVCRLLISHGARINCANSYGFTPLHAAVEIQCRYELIEDVRRVLTEKEWYIYKSQLPKATQDAKKGKLSVCKLLISNGANINALNKLDDTPLDHAAKLGKVDICKLLILHGTNIKASNDVKRWYPPPLNIAAEKGYKAICDLLISNGANIHSLRSYDDTPLHCAASSGKVSVCKLLISKGANINAVNKMNMTPLDYTIHQNETAFTDFSRYFDDSIWPGSSNSHTAMLHRQKMSGQVDVFKLLVENGANINNSCLMNRDTPLHFAVRHKLLSVSKLIISKGANVNSLNGLNETPLMLSFSKKCVALTAYLLENDAFYCPGGKDYGRDIYSSMLTWLVTEVSLERAIAKKWFWRLSNLTFKIYDFSTSTLKSSCRKKIREDEPHIKIGNNLKGVHIPKTLKEYLIQKEELVDLFQENIRAEISSQAQVLVE
ncbi:hypothetical protein QYM36_007090 [Artemia franciscana]|uniref:Uncharacterized protein n=1 Tax=Artemia franciscana TaxID=6661 RepID=A0AA88I7T2_ARTSF|nr:hypothetical protein QYM36_007090 [Artemia franciscana]